MTVSPRARRRRAGATLAAVISVMQGLDLVAAQSSAGSSSTDSVSIPGSASSTSTASSSSFWADASSDVGFTATTSTAAILAQQWFLANFLDNQTELAVGVNSALTNLTGSEVICNGVPSVQRRTLETLPNFGCPDIFTAVDASCSCLASGYTDVDTWEFHVTLRGAESEYPMSFNSTDVLPIDSIRTLLVPSTLKTLRIIADGSQPQNITIVPQDKRIPGQKLPIALAPSGSISITAVELANIDMSMIARVASTFLPATTRNLTMRNCKVSIFGYNFFKGVNDLEYLDLSSNELTAAYAGSTIASSCSNSFCAIKILNLSNNHLSVFPTVVFNLDDLQELYIANNAITDFNVTVEVFTAIKNLAVFESDLPDESSTCVDGIWQTTHNSLFCVAAVASKPEDSSSSGSCDTWLVVFAIIGGVLVVVLVLLLAWQRYRKLQHQSPSFASSSDYYVERHFDDTLSIEDSQREASQSLLDDPVIVTSRIDYKSIKLGKCISKGGFGLVFIGEYKGRRVAIKKIRPDRNDPKDVRLFLKEISLMALLYHPRIVEFIGVGWDSIRHLSAVTEFMDNGDLRGVLRSFKQQGQRLSWQNHKTSIALHIAEALSYLHSRKPKVIHRDLKSKNVLLNMHLEAKLSDFGVSRERYLIQTHDMTARIGTSFWIAPEVLLGCDYDERADIYSFGVVLSEIDTDDYPFWNDANPNAARGKIQEADILSQVAAGRIRPQLSDDCPGAIMVLADSCLQKDPDDRPSADEIIDILKNILRSSAPPPSSTPFLMSQSSSSGSGWTVDYTGPGSSSVP